MVSHLQNFGRKVEVLSTFCTETNCEQLHRNLEEYCQDPDSPVLAIDFTNVHIVAMRDSESEFRNITSKADLFIPDSTILTWASRIRGSQMRESVYGPRFLSYMIEESSPQLTHFFLGASEDCLDKLLSNIQERNPNFKIAGSHHGYFGLEDEEKVLKQINKAKADLVWIGLGTPKQQEWIYRFKDRVERGALLAVGFAFDVNAGTKKDSPAWMQKCGLTWFYRFTQEPMRLWERYTHYNFLFLSRFWEQLLRDGLNGYVFDTQIPQDEGNLKPPSGVSLTTPFPISEQISVRKEENLYSRTNVLGVGISSLNLENATEALVTAAEQPEINYVTVTGVHGVMESQRSSELKRIHNASFLTVPDGMPMVWMNKWSGSEETARVYGPDLLLAVAQKSVERKQKHFFFGGKKGIAKELGNCLKTWFPGLVVVGHYCPPFRPLDASEESALIDELQRTQPHFLWVGLSTPKQEKFMNHLASTYPGLTKDWDHGLVLVGVGAAFDFHTGRLAQAPRWMQDRGLEWFFRLLVEPKRLFPRYFKNNTTFMWSIFLQMTGLKSYHFEHEPKA